MHQKNDWDERCDKDSAILYSPTQMFSNQTAHDCDLSGDNEYKTVLLLQYHLVVRLQVRVVIRTVRYMIHRALEHHANVHVIIEIGNHDPSSSVFLTELKVKIKQLEDDNKVEMFTINGLVYRYKTDPHHDLKRIYL